ncbi:MAG: cation transporter [Eubacterium sp.]|nr:cation transporter [Eubacterium sp.]
MDDKTVVKTVVRVSGVSIISNIILSLLKLLAGVFGRSMAMLSDAIHSLSDVFSTIIVIIGVKMAKKEEDSDHQYGHDRMESLASLALGAILFLTGALLIYEGIKKIYLGEEISTPGSIALIAAVVSIVAKEGMYWYTKKAADRIHSDALRADAWHHRSDALSSIGSLIGVAGAMLGVKILDPVMAGIIGLVIIKVAYDIVKEAVDKMVDKACDEEIVRAMKELVLSVEGVEGLDLIKTRMFGTKMYVDIEISADGNLLLKQSHEIAEAVHDNIEKQFAGVKHCTVHVNPAGYEHKKLP